MSAQIVQLRRDAASWRVMQSKTATEEQRHAASAKLGLTYPQDLLWARAGVTGDGSQKAVTEFLSDYMRPKPVPVTDFAPRYPDPDVGKQYPGPVFLVAIIVIGLAFYGAERLGGDAMRLALQFINN